MRKIQTRSSLCLQVKAAGDNWSNIQVHIMRTNLVMLLRLQLKLCVGNMDVMRASL